MNKKVLFIAMFLLCAFKMNAQMVVIKSDALRDLALMPNVHIDFVVGEKHSVGIGGAYCPTLWGADVKLATLTPNFRYWFNGRPFTRQYVGVSGQLAMHDIAWGKKNYDGTSFALGLIFGHVFNLSQRWNIELEAGVNARYYTQKEYFKGDVLEDLGDGYNSRGAMLSPHISIAFSYIIK